MILTFKKHTACKLLEQITYNKMCKCALKTLIKQ